MKQDDPIILNGAKDIVWRPRFMLQKVSSLIPFPLMGEGWGGGEINILLHDLIPPPPNPLPPGEGEFDGWMLRSKVTKTLKNS